MKRQPDSLEISILGFFGKEPLNRHGAHRVKDVLKQMPADSTSEDDLMTVLSDMIHAGWLKGRSLLGPGGVTADIVDMNITGEGERVLGGIVDVNVISEGSQVHDATREVGGDDQVPITVNSTQATPSPDSIAPKCFISYSWDSEDHKIWVRKLAEGLRAYHIDAILDQWGAQPGTDLAHFMERADESDFVAVVCTAKYAHKANVGEAGVGYEKRIITAALRKLHAQDRRIIPVLRESGPEVVPTFLTDLVSIDFSSDSEFDKRLQELARAIFGKPECVPPPLGPMPELPPAAPLYMLPNHKERPLDSTPGLEQLYTQQPWNWPVTARRRVPVGIMANDEPFYLDLEFLDGAKGAHVSISGVSGVATKTSFALFLLYSIFHFEGTKQGDQQMQDGMPFADKAAARSIVFNVKGEDMLFLDKPNKGLTDDHRAVYTKMGLPAMPFTDVRFFTSFTADGEIPSPSTEQRQEGVTPYVWTMQQFAQDRLLPFLFAEGDQETTNLYGLIQHLTNRLDYLASNRNMENDPRSGALVYQGQTIGNLHDLITILETDIMGPADSEDEGKKGKRPSSGGWFTSFESQGTQLAFLRRLRVAADAMKGVIRSDVDHPDKYRFEFNQHRVTVVDISKLKPVAQKFIVGSTLKMLMTQKEAQGRKPYVFVVLDELNKYAPREGHSPIQDILLDIAERGRSLGVILIGAQQSVGRVKKDITENCSIRVNGRLDYAESKSPEYDYLPEPFRQDSTILKPGTMIVHQPDIPAPVLINFPLPAWATRGEEVDDQDLDKAAREFAERF